MMQDTTALRAELIETARGMNLRGINVNKSGNVSARACRADGAEGFLITPTGMPYESLTPDDLVWIPLVNPPSLRNADGARRPSSEWEMHARVYLRRSDIDAVVHTHSCFATALACQDMPIPPFHYMVAAAGGHSIDVAPYATFGTPELARVAAEALAVIHAKDDSDVDSIHEDLRHQILDCKDVHKVDSSTDSMDFFNHMPRWLGKFLVWILTRLDIHGWIPASIIETDPYYTTCVISNLGSIKLNCGYHHLTNWGTCSVFCIIGEKSKRPVYHEDGTIEMREMLDLGLTIDERLADGYYYSKTIRLLKTLLENPELLETPANQEVAY